MHFMILTHDDYAGDRQDPSAKFIRWVNCLVLRRQGGGASVGTTGSGFGASVGGGGGGSVGCGGADVGCGGFGGSGCGCPPLFGTGVAVDAITSGTGDGNGASVTMGTWVAVLGGRAVGRRMGRVVGRGVAVALAVGEGIGVSVLVGTAIRGNVTVGVAV